MSGNYVCIKTVRFDTCPYLSLSARCNKTNPKIKGFSRNNSKDNGVGSWRLSDSNWHCCVASRWLSTARRKAWARLGFVQASDYISHFCIRSFTFQKQVDEFCHSAGLRQAEAGGVALQSYYARSCPNRVYRIAIEQTEYRILCYAVLLPCIRDVIYVCVYTLCHTLKKNHLTCHVT